jgi:hypothetical protein
MGGKNEMKKSNIPIEFTAYHEAGHAVVAIHLGLARQNITIKPDKDYLGCVTGPNPRFGYDVSSKRQRNSIFRDEIISLYAGAEAEKIMNPNFDATMSADDDNQAFDLLRNYPVRGCSFVGDDVYLAYLEKLRREARRVVRQLWPAIEIIAQELQRRGELNSEEVIALYEREKCLILQGGK